MKAAAKGERLACTLPHVPNWSQWVFRFRLPTAKVVLVWRVVLCRARLFDEAELQLNSQRF